MIRSYSVDLFLPAPVEPVLYRMEQVGWWVSLTMAGSPRLQPEMIHFLFRVQCLFSLFLLIIYRSKGGGDADIHIQKADGLQTFVKISSANGYKQHNCQCISKQNIRGQREKAKYNIKHAEIITDADANMPGGLFPLGAIPL